MAARGNLTVNLKSKLVSCRPRRERARGDCARRSQRRCPVSQCACGGPPGEMIEQYGTLCRCSGPPRVGGLDSATSPPLQIEECLQQVACHQLLLDPAA